MKCVYDVCGWEYDKAASFPRNGIASGKPQLQYQQCIPGVHSLRRNGRPGVRITAGSVWMIHNRRGNEDWFRCRDHGYQKNSPELVCQIRGVYCLQDHILRLTLQPAFQVPEDDFRPEAHGFPGGKGHMGSDQTVFAVQQRFV